MDASEAYAREVGMADVVLSTESSMHAAHRRYEHRGYTREFSRDWEVRGFHAPRLPATAVACGVGYW
jgi:hypothetical protein